jgi:hypothetical protein
MPIASASRARAWSVTGNSCVCSSFHSCKRFSMRRRNRYASSNSTTTSAGELLAREQWQRVEQAPRLQAGRAAAAQQLEGLDDEFDLANAARPELHVLLQLAALDVPRNHFLHAAQRLEDAKIEVSPVNEGAQHVAVQSIEARSPPKTGEPSRRRSVPSRALLLQVVFERVEAHCHGPESPNGRNRRSTR